VISLGKHEIGDAVNAPWKYTVEVSDAMNSGPLDDRDVSVIYDATELLLILGEPGGGKTTVLLDLARTLLDRAKSDIRERVPIVLNLSSWKKKQPLVEWISNELSGSIECPGKSVVSGSSATIYASFGWTGRVRNRVAAGLRRCDQRFHRRS
jgi:predicted NACHT family NTPase